VEECGRAGLATDGNITRRMHFACWIPKATNTHSEYVIIVFPLQKWLRERSPLTLHAHCMYCFMVILFVTSVIASCYISVSSSSRL